MVRLSNCSYRSALFINQTIVVVVETSNDRTVSRLSSLDPHLSGYTFSKLDLIRIELERCDRGLCFPLKTDRRPIERFSSGSQLNIREVATTAERLADRQTNLTCCRCRNLCFYLTKAVTDCS